MGAEAADWQIEELSSEHDRTAFSCGHESLDTFLKQYAGQSQKTGVSRTFVALDLGEKVVRGYYALAAGALKFEDLTNDQRKRLPRYPAPVAHLGRLAVDRSAQGRGLGEHLLIDALSRVDRAEREIGVHAIEVVAIDDAARRFYLKYGFLELRDDPHHLYIPICTSR